MDASELEIDIFSFKVDENHHGQRLDHFLVHLIQNKSRAQIQNWIQSQAVTLEGCGPEHTLTPHTKVKQNQIFHIHLPKPKESFMKGQSIPLEILFEDEDLLVISKPRGMVVHPAPGHRDHTLVNALLHHCKDSLSGIGGVMRPGIVHRLDKDTSGLMVVAKNDHAHLHLSGQFHSQTESTNHTKLLRRSYKALVFGKLLQSTVTIDTMMGRHPKNRQKMAICGDEKGKRAITHFKTEKLWVFDDGQFYISLLDCTLETGRTHQIRLHCQHLHCPVIGDPVYTMTRYRFHPSHKLRSVLPATLFEKNGQLLHAYHLSFIHPRHHEVMNFSCVCPKIMEQVIQDLNERLEKDRDKRFNEVE